MKIIRNRSIRRKIAKEEWKIQKRQGKIKLNFVEYWRKKLDEKK